MLVLITYDVNTQTEAGKNVYEKSQKSVSIMANEFKIQYLSARWMQRNADRLKIFWRIS